MSSKNGSLDEIVYHARWDADSMYRHSEQKKISSNVSFIFSNNISSYEESRHLYSKHVWINQNLMKLSSGTAAALFYFFSISYFIIHFVWLLNWWVFASYSFALFELLPPLHLNIEYCDTFLTHIELSNEVCTCKRVVQVFPRMQLHR